MTTAVGGNPLAAVAVSEPAQVTLTAGMAGEARFTVVAADGYHVQANPASGDFFVPVELDLKAAGGVSPGKPVYPPGTPYRLPGTADDLMTYEGTFEIVLPLRAGASARQGNHVLKGSLRYQACDARSCLFPASVPVTLAVRVVAAPRPGRNRPRATR